MESLENQIDRLSRAVFGEALQEERDLDRVLEILKKDQGPVTLTLWWDEERKQRQSVVLHQIEGGQVRLYDPTHTLAEEDGEARVPLATLKEWFEERDAVALVRGDAS